MAAIDFPVHVRPNARRTFVGGSHDGVLVVTVAAAPTDGQANDAVCRAVAKAFGVRATACRIVRGQTSRRKHLRLDVSDETDAARIMRELLDG